MSAIPLTCMHTHVCIYAIPLTCMYATLLTCMHTRRGVAVPLVNSFAIPDHILRAPIGLAGSGVSDMYKEYLLAAGFDV